MPRKAVVVDTGLLVQQDGFLGTTDASVTSSADKVVQGNSAGKIDSSWIGSVPFTALPVAADGENSSTKVVRADDSRLSNPTVNGDVTGTLQATTVTKLRGRSIPATTPNDGQVLRYQQSTDSWVYGDVSSSSSLTVTDGTTTVSNVTQLTFSSITNNGGGSVTVNDSGGDGGVGTFLYLFHRFY